MSASIYEINTRSWIKQFGDQVTLAQTPDLFWTELANLGIDYVWLMGVWQTTPSSIEQYCFHPDLTQGYTLADPAWTRQDIGGSPYAIEDYVLMPALGSWQDLIALRKQLKALGLKLILDFIPNHFNAHTNLTKTHPEVFIEVDHFSESETVLRNGRYFAHGRDPYFAPWTDTIQVNYQSQKAQDFMCQRLLHIADYCDGVRCDMAMLMLPDVFVKTWSHFLPNGDMPNFWKETIASIKSKHPAFICIGEAYWDLEWELQQLGFDYTYDKKMLDLLKQGNVPSLIGHLRAEDSYQRSSVHFIENHDEDRSLYTMGETKSRAAAVLMSTTPGLHLYYDGQWEGFLKRMPVQMMIYSAEKPCPCPISSKTTTLGLKGGIRCACQVLFYRALLAAVNHPVFKEGQYQVVDSDPQSEPLVIRIWTHQSDVRIVIVNYMPIVIKTKIHLPTAFRYLKWQDVLNDIPEPAYFSALDEQQYEIELSGFKSTILASKIKPNALG